MPPRRRAHCPATPARHSAGTITVVDDDLQRLRVEYDGIGLTADQAGTDPMGRFGDWFADARSRTTVAEANACSFATVARDGTPSVRMVLLKQVDPERAAFVVYTNLDGRKGVEAATAGRAALCWWWPGMPGRQVRVVGHVELVDREEAERYFRSRPAAAQVGAVASPQSRAIERRRWLEERAAAVDPGSVRLPERWGGLRIVADELELWQGRPGRLHDRIAFLRIGPEGDLCAKAAVEVAGGEDHVRAVGTPVVDPYGAPWLRLRLAP